MATVRQIEAAKKALADGKGIGAAIDASTAVDPDMKMAAAINMAVIGLMDDELKPEDKLDDLLDAIGNNWDIFRKIIREYAQELLI